MKKLKTLSLVIAALLLTFSTAPAFAADAKTDKKAAAGKAPEVIEQTWSKRCNEKTKTDCEIFDVLAVKQNKARIAEFAIGFPPSEKLKKGTARGVVILPLGVLLEPGVGLKVDDKKPITFKVRYCTNAGCFSYIDLDEDMLEDMQKAKQLNFFFRSMDGKEVRLIMGLTGFPEALKSITP